MTKLLCCMTLLFSTMACRGAPATTLTKPLNTEPLEEIDDLSSWLTHFYERPDPDRIPMSIRRMNAEGYFEKGPLLCVAFLAEVFRDYPGRVAAWASSVHDLAEDERHWISIAIWWSGIPATDEILETFVPDASEDFAASLASYRTDSPTALVEMQLTPPVLDALWASYFAGGRTLYLDRLISALSLDHTAQAEIREQLVHSAATWSLTSNAQQHATVLQHLQKVAQQSEGIQKDELGAIVAAALASTPERTD